MDPLDAVCSMTNPSQSNQISMTNFARSQQKKLRKNCGKLKFVCKILNPTVLAFRMYEHCSLSRHAVKIQITGVHINQSI